MGDGVAGARLNSRLRRHCNPAAPPPGAREGGEKFVALTIPPLRKRFSA